MAGDYTRFRYNPLRDSTGILMQQGKVLVDQDWNEQTLLEDRRWRTETTDIIGRAVVPIETPNGFEILIAGTNLTIGRGRMYVDGLMAENHGSGPMEFDPILGETRGTLPTPYDKQPYFPNPPALPTDTNPHLVYLDVWEREVTYLEDIDRVDKAIAVDTAACLQTVWQVKVLNDTPAGTDCSTPSGALAATAPSAGRLTTAAAGVPASTDPCIVPMTGGYRGSGNRLYRIEIHTGGPLGTAQFKWSRDNASVASAVTGINAARDTLSVVMTKRDSVLRFQPNDWVEITDDVSYFQGLPGEMAQVAAVNDVNLTIQLKKPLAGAFDATKPERHTRVIRWDQSGIVRDPLGAVIVDVDTNNGLIPVPAGGVAVVLEDGMQVTFSIDAAMPVPQFRPLEYWAFAARVVDASIEVLTAAPPRGIIHHYAWLGFVTFPSGVTNCRVFWPPDFGASCDCTVCVSAVSHNTGKLTIQAAVNQVKGKGGGKICLGPGVYNIDTTIAITGATAIEIQGHGLPSLQATPKLVGQQPMILIERSIDIAIKDLSIAAGLSDPTGAGVGSLPGVVVRNTFFVRFHRCAFVFGTDGTLIANGRTLAPAIALSDLTADTDIQWNFFNNVDIGIGDVRADAKSRLVRALSIESNQMVCAQSGVRLLRPSIGAFSEVRFANNFVQSPFGFILEGVGLDLTLDGNTFNLPQADSSVAIVCNISQARISNNQIFGDRVSPNSNGIILGSGLGGGNSVMYGTQVIGNRISNLSGVGISVTESTLLLETIIAQNQLLNLGTGGIVMRITPTANASAVDLTISGNSLAFVANAVDTGFSPQLMAGIQIGFSVNVNVTENAVENVGLDPKVNAGRYGIAADQVSGIRVAGNRVLNIGPNAAFSLSAGVLLVSVLGRIDVPDNEIRRFTTPPGKGDSAPWIALGILAVGHVSVRGNLLDSIGRSPTVTVGMVGSCIFSENQCIYGGIGALAVRIRGSAVIASSNYIESPSGVAVTTAMDIQATGAYSVIGNIATGISANGVALLSNPHIPLAVDTLNA